MKRIISTILTVSMLFTMAPAFASDVDTADVNNTLQLFSVGDGEAVVKQSAKQPAIKVADFEEQEVGQITGTSVSGTNFTFKSSPAGGTEAYYIEQDDSGNKYITLTNEAGGYNTTAGSGTSVATTLLSDVDKLGISYRIRFNKPVQDWHAINISSGGLISGSYADGGRFGVNYGGDYKNNTGAQTKYGGTTPGLVKVTTGVWYTISYVIDYDTYTYDMSIVPDSGDVEITTTTKDGTDPLKGIPFRAAKVNKGGSITFIMPHDSKDTSTTAEGSFSIDDISVYNITNELTFSLIGPETLSDEADMRLEYNNTIGEDKDVCVTYVAYEDGIVADTDEVMATLTVDNNVADIPVSVDTSACDGEVTYGAFVTDAATGATLCTAGSNEGTSVPEDFVTATEADGKINVKVAKDSAYDAAVIRVYDEDENLVGIKEQKISNAAIAFGVNDYNKQYKVDVTLADAAGNAAYAKTYVTVWDPAIAEDFNNDPEAAFETHMDALNKAYGGDFASIYEANSEYINNYVMMRDDYTSVYDIIDTVVSLEGFLAVVAAEDEAAFAGAIEANADSLGITLDSVYEENKDAIIAQLFANKDDFIVPDDFVAAYNDAYITSEFNAAAAISYSRLFEKYKAALGITVDSQYYAGEATINELVYKYKTDSEGGIFADADDVAKAYRNAKNNATDAVGYATVATSPVSKNEVVLDFDNNNTGYAVVIKEGQEAFGSYEIATDENSNNYLTMKQLAGGEDAVQLTVNDLPKEGIINVSERLKFEKLDTGYMYLRIMGAYLYTENNKWGINYGGGKMDTSGTIEPVQEDMWYDINFVLDCTGKEAADKTFDAVITDENGNVVFEDSGTFRTNEVGSILVWTPHKDGTNEDGSNKVTSADTVICVDDIVVSTESAPAVYYSAKASENVIEGSNGIAVAIENLTGADRNINVYIPVYVDGVLYTVANEQAYFADGTDDEILVTYEIGEDVDVSKVTYDVIVADSLDGTNHSVVSEKDSGTVEVDASADYEAEIINVSVANTFDNGAIIALKPGATISSADMSDILYYAEGNTAAFKIADGISGDLKVYAVAQNADGVVTKDSTEVYYPGNGAAAAMKDDFNAVTEETVSSVMDKYIDIIENSAPGMKEFYVENTDAVNAAIVANKPYESTQDIVNTVKSVKALAALKGAASEAVFKGAFKDFADMFDVTFDEIYTANEDAFVSSMYADKASFNTYEDVMAAYNAIYMIYDINAATEDTIGAKLAQYAEALGIEFDEVYTSKQLYIDRLVAADIPFADAAAIVSSYNNAYAKAEAIEGEFVETTVSSSAAQIAKSVIDFENCELVENVTTASGMPFSFTPQGDGSFSVVSEGNNKHLVVRQAQNTNTSTTGVGFNISSVSGKKVTVEYQIRFDKPSDNWTMFNLGEVSSLYLNGNKFNLNEANSAATTDEGKGGQKNISGVVSPNVWYTVKYTLDFDTQSYNITIKDGNGAEIANTDTRFRYWATRTISSLPNLSLYTPQKEDAEYQVSYDNIQAYATPDEGVYYNVTGISSLLPGKNTFNVEITNAQGLDKVYALYVPVYADGKLVSIDKFDIAAPDGMTTTESYDVTVSADLINNSTVDYKMFVVDAIDGTNHGIASKAVLPRTTTPAAPVADYATKAIKVSGTTTYDNMFILVTGPVADGRDYDIEAAKTDASVIAYYAPAELTAISSETDNATQEKITTSSFAVDVKVPDKFVNGDYNIYFVSQNKAGEVQTSYAYTYYAGSSLLDDMLADFNNITAENAEETVYTYMEVLEGVAADAADFYGNNKETVNEALLAEDSFANVGEINSVIFAIYAIDKMASAADAEEFKATFEYYANVFGIDTATAEYIACAAEINERLYAEKDELTIENIADKYDEALMLAEFNNADRTTVKDVLAKYKDVTGLDPESADYKKYEADINKNMSAESVIFNSVEDIKAAYNKGVNAGKDNSESSSASKPSSNRGGGGSGGSGGSGIVSTTVAQPYVETETTLEGTVAATAAFTDLDTVPWAVEAITELKKYGVINGVSDTQFAPDRAVTREEFAKMIVNAFSISGEGKSFADVPATAWYAPYVTSLASSGIVNGISDTEFGVGANITRQDAAVMLDRTAQFVGIEYEFDISALDIFTDYMADYARISIYRLYQTGVVNGTSATTFSGTDTLTRAQAAKMIYGLMQLK